MHADVALPHWLRSGGPLHAQSPPHLPLPQGTTYNSYLIFGADKTALVDASHEKFRGLYMRTLNEELAKRGRQIDYVLVSHTEPDHSGAAAAQRGAGCCRQLQWPVAGEPAHTCAGVPVTLRLPFAHTPVCLQAW